MREIVYKICTQNFNATQFLSHPVNILGENLELRRMLELQPHRKVPSCQLVDGINKRAD